MFELQTLTYNEWITNGYVLLLSLFLFFISRPLITKIHSKKIAERRIKIFRSVILVFTILFIVDILLLHGMPTYENELIKLGKSILAIYIISLFIDIISVRTVSRFGTYRKVDGEGDYIPSYSSRMIDIISTILLSLILLYIVIKIWELDSLLQATGIFGVTFAFLALTNKIWAPDIYFGLVILNSNMLEDGDTIQMEGSDVLYIIHRVNFINTILSNVQNNHRTLIRNSRLLHGRLDNLTRRASIDGLRYSIDYKIGYPAMKDIPLSERHEAIDTFHKNIEHMFLATEEGLKKLNNTRLRNDLGFEWYLKSTDDFALVYRLSYYLEPLPITRLTRKIREHINKPQAEVNELVYLNAALRDIHLETPMLINKV